MTMQFESCSSKQEVMKIIWFEFVSNKEYSFIPIKVWTMYIYIYNYIFYLFEPQRTSDGAKVFSIYSETLSGVTISSDVS